MVTVHFPEDITAVLDVNQKSEQPYLLKLFTASKELPWATIRAKNRESLERLIQYDLPSYF